MDTLDDKGTGIVVNQADAAFTWKRSEYGIYAVLQLILVFLAYRLDRMKHPSIIPESAWAIFLGMVFGLAIKLMSPFEAGQAGLHPDVFFFYLLPPIILEAGFNMKKRGFFANFNTILLLSVIGTLVVTFFTGSMLFWMGQRGLITPMSSAEAYLYGSLISAIDPVATLSVFKKVDAPPLLFNLVFGESMLNDGVAIVAFTLFQEAVLQEKVGLAEEVVNLTSVLLISVKVIGIGIGSVLLAAMVCSTSAFLLKKADSELQDYPNYEISIILLSAYISYVSADLAGLSGIVALFFSGVLMSHYHLYTISRASATALTHLLSTLAFLAENFIFLYLGISVVVYSDLLVWDWRFCILNLCLCLVARAMNTFPLCFLANLKREHPVPFEYQIVLWFSGLRGAIAFALALKVQTHSPAHAGIIRSATLFTVITTTLIFGMSTGPLLSLLDLDKKGRLPQDKVERAGDVSRHQNPPPQAGLVDDIWQKMDEQYLQPLFGGQIDTAADLMSEQNQEVYLEYRNSP